MRECIRCGRVDDPAAGFTYVERLGWQCADSEACDAYRWEKIERDAPEQTRVIESLRTRTHPAGEGYLSTLISNLRNVYLSSPDATFSAVEMRWVVEGFLAELAARGPGRTDPEVERIVRGIRRNYARGVDVIDVTVREGRAGATALRKDADRVYARGGSGYLAGLEGSELNSVAASVDHLADLVEALLAEGAETTAEPATTGDR